MAIRWANFEYGVVDTTWPTHVEEQERLLNCTHWYRLQAHTNIPNYWPYLGAFRLRGRLEDCELHVFRRGQDRIFVARAVSDNVLWLNVTLSSHKEALKATRTFAMSVEVIGSIYIPARAVRGLALSDRSVDWTEIGVDRAEKMDGTGLRSQVAKEAIKVMQKYLERHEQFQRFDQNSGPPRSSPEGRRAAAQTREGKETKHRFYFIPLKAVVNDRLGARFERKLAQLRTHVTPSLVTPSLVFHGAPSQEPQAVVMTGRNELMARTVRRADRAWVALAAVTAARESCEVSQWLQEEAVDQGYHVLCISEQEPIQLYVEGLQSQMLQLQGGKLVERLEEKLHIRRHLEFLEEGQSTVTQWPKQSWAVFTSEGERWRPEELDELVEGYRGVALLFEGGVWRWPPVRPGFRRSVLPGVVLETVATRPALFSLDLAPESGTADASASRLLRHAAATAERRLFRSETESQVSEERTSDQAWLSYGSTPELRELKDFTARVLRIPATYFEEKLQVLRYQKGQYYDAHRDYWDPAEFPYEDRFLHANSQTWLMRHATFFWYLQRPEKGRLGMQLLEWKAGRPGSHGRMEGPFPGTNGQPAIHVE
ncbi:unnamed protein product [Durusdinium trenchii]|uniref:Prolyl 4-hydroxylase alpha subunit domain-containing protein n=2 Tax=Durusdinium trenchii TaxID=1381693 RepID=A0ABP0HK79_9DINO